MTYEEAIKDLEQMKQNYLDMDICFGLVQSLDLAIECIEKQIPKKVITEYGEIFDCDKNGNETRFVFNFCPSCQIRFMRYGMKHCPECGQAIDWSE